MPETVRQRLTIPAEQAGQRLDQALAQLLSEYSRSRIKEWIDAGQILVDGSRARPKDRVLGGESVEVEAELPDLAQVEP